jgi:hypothetical protein
VFEFFLWNDLWEFGEDLVGICEGYLEVKTSRSCGNFGCVVFCLGPECYFVF